MQTNFTIADVLAWARTKPADEAYVYYCDECALGQFLTETGRRLPFADYDWGAAVDTIGGKFGHVLSLAPWTFGGLVARLEALCPATPLTASNWQRIDAYLADLDTVAA